MSNIAVRKEVAMRYVEEKKRSPNHRLNNGCFDDLAAEILLLRNITNDVKKSPSLIQRRVQSGNLMVYNTNGEKVSPFAEHKPYFN